MDAKEREGRIKDLFDPIIAEFGAECVQLQISQYQKTWMIKAVVDLPQGGISIGTCGRINRALSTQLEESEWMDQSYQTEVSSPGVDWPLTTQKDFMRVQGRQVRVTLKDKVEDRLEYTGQLEKVLAETIVLNVNEQSVEIPLKIIQKAIQWI